MIVSDSGQGKVFLINIAIGMLCVMLYDLLRVIVKGAGGKKKITLIADTAYFFHAFLIVLYAQVKFNLGALRYYQLFALVIGAVFYRLVLSHVTRRVFAKVIVIGFKGAGSIWKLIYVPFIFIFGHVFGLLDLVEEKIILQFSKIGKKAKKVKIKQKNKQKTAKKRLKMI